MKITILNGNSDLQNTSFDEYLVQLTQILTEGSHRVTNLNLCQMNVENCNGCFGCWVKTPGECVIEDDSPGIRQAVIQSDFTLYASPLKMGYPSALLKRAMDKSVPLIHPYFTVVNQEVHHLARYKHYPRVGLLFEREQDTDDDDLRIVTNLFGRTAINMKSSLVFSLDTSQPPAEVARLISNPPSALIPESHLRPTNGIQVKPPTRLTVFNGSPRGPKGNTLIMQQEFIRGFTSIPGNTCEVFNLFQMKRADDFVQAFSNAESVLLGFPLYTDAMPSIVKSFIESLEPFKGRPANPPIGFLVQSGFPEGLHSRHVERYLEKFAHRLGSPYLGTMVKGNGEAVGNMPENMNKGLFENLFGTGRGLAENGSFDAVLLRKMASPERYSPLALPLVQVMSWTFVKSYWDQQLKQNGAYEDRFARPYEVVR